MKFTINTAILQEMVSKSVKCASNDNQRPLTGLIAIQLKDNLFTLITCSESNYLYVNKENIVGDDFHVVVPVEIFSKLVSKLTAESTTLEFTENTLVVKSGGTYSIEVSLNEEGEFTKYPDPFNKIDLSADTTKHYPIKRSTLNLILAVNSASLAAGEVAKDLPEVYRGYYVSDSIVTTDTVKMCGVNIKVCDTPMMVRPETIKLTEVFSDENLEIAVQDDAIIIRSLDSADCVIMSRLMSNIEDFQIDALNGLLATNFESDCAINKTVLLQVLDRLSLFIDKFDDFGVYLTFTQDGIKFANKKSSSEELISYEASNNFKPFTCKVDIKMLIEQVKAAPGDLINLKYGDEVCLKFTDGNVTQLVALNND